MWWTQSASSSWDIIHVSKDWRMEGLCGHRLQSGEGRPGLEAVFRGETCSWERPPVPAVQEVAVEMCIPIERVVGVRCHPSFLLRFSSVCRTGDEERPTLVLLKDRWDSPFHPAAHYPNTFTNTTRSDSHLSNYRPHVVHIQRHIVFPVQRHLGNGDAEPVRREGSFVFIVPAPDDYGRMRLEALNLNELTQNETDGLYRQDRMQHSGTEY